MSVSTLSPQAYARALTLRERGHLLKTHCSHELLPISSEVPASVRRRESRWRDRSASAHPERFSERLAAEGFVQSDVHRLLDIEGAWVPPTQGMRPAWCEIASPHGDHDGEEAQDRGSLAPFMGFLALAWPQLVEAQGALMSRLDRIDGIEAVCGSPRRYVELATPALARVCVESVSPVLVLELNVMRLRGQLAGGSSEERFQDFVRQLRSPDLRGALFEEYPVLLRTLRQAAAQWVQHWCEVAERLVADRSDIERTVLQGRGLGVLEEILPGGGDRHHDGRHVAILRFTTGHHLVYKPRALSVDIAYQRLLAWLAAGVGDHTMVMPTYLARQHHGWSAYVTHQECTSIEDVSTFYRRLGMQLALLYVLDATDMHLENLIACGSTPVLVDLEALFHPRVSASPDSARSSSNPSGRAAIDAWTPYYESVMRVGLLPTWSYQNADGDAIELSGVGGKADQLLPDEQPVLSEIGLDTMHVGRARLRMAAAKNQPQLAETPIDPAAYTEPLVQGFEAAYRCMADRREDLLRPEGLLDAFRNVPVRAVLRHTKLYATLLRDSFHPDLLRDAVDRDIHFETLWRVLDGRPWYSRVVQHELQDLWRGDIPHFTARPASTSLWTSDGEEIQDFFAETAHANVLRRIQTLSTTDCERQSWFIRAALATLHAETHTVPAQIRHAPGVLTGGPHDKQAQTSAQLHHRAHQMARHLTDRLVALSIGKGDEVGWLGVSLVRDKHWSLQPLGDDLYNGRLGVALFLLEAKRLLGHSSAGILACDVLDSSVHRYVRMFEASDKAPQVSHAAPQPFMGGAYHALSGSAFVLAHAASVLDEPRYASMASQLLQRASENIQQDEQLDVIAGVAGFVLVAVTLLQQQPDPALSHSVARACDHLVATAEAQPIGVGWRTRVEATQPLTGFSHGASGMALALHRAGQILGRPDYCAVATQAMRYERACFDAMGGYWPDYRQIASRTSEERPPTMNAWCHGAPGIGLARLEILETTRRNGSDLHQDLSYALRETCARGFQGNHSLCHGMLGNFALVERARRSGIVPDEVHGHPRIAQWILDSIEQAGPLCGIPKGIETPGLMTGLAGIGLGLLQLAGDDVVDVLTFTLPAMSAR